MNTSLKRCRRLASLVSRTASCFEESWELRCVHYNRQEHSVSAKSGEVFGSVCFAPSKEQRHRGHNAIDTEALRSLGGTIAWQACYCRLANSVSGRLTSSRSWQSAVAVPAGRAGCRAQYLH